ncbi:MAG: mechanosensitive ion channel [Polyangiaceae bacterium]|nr:mechanosensitive ion channel [Polyangiaceae bacterium]
MANDNALDTGRGLLKAELFSIGNTPITVTTLATMVAIVVISYLVARAVRAAIRRAVERRGLTGTHGNLRAVGRLLQYAILLVGLAIALQTGGIELSALFAVSAVFVVGVGLALQNIAQNFVAGIVLLFEGAIKPGDIIEIDGRLAKVVRMGARATIARSLDEEDLIIPNHSLMLATIKNLSMNDSLYRLRVTVGVSYGSDLDQVERLLTEAGTGFAKRDPTFEPRVLLTEFGSSSVDWELSVWIQDPWVRRSAGSALRRAIWNTFRAEGVVIAFPQVDVHFDAPVTSAVVALGKVTNVRPSTEVA